MWVITTNELTQSYRTNYADIYERTISEEYTPLHLAARFNPAHSQEFDESVREERGHCPRARVVTDNGEGYSRALVPVQKQNSVEEVFSLLLRQDKVNVS